MLVPAALASRTLAAEARKLSGSNRASVPACWAGGGRGQPFRILLHRYAGGMEHRRAGMNASSTTIGGNRLPQLTNRKIGAKEDTIFNIFLIFFEGDVPMPRWGRTAAVVGLAPRAVADHRHRRGYRHRAARNTQGKRLLRKEMGERLKVARRFGLSRVLPHYAGILRPEKSSGCKRVRRVEGVAVWVARNFRPTKKVATGAGTPTALSAGFDYKKVIKPAHVATGSDATMALPHMQEQTRPAAHYMVQLFGLHHGRRNR